MTKLYRAAGAVFMLSAVAMAASGCMGPTYGTGKSANQQLIDDLAGSFSLNPPKPKPVAYQPRGKLVQPVNDKQLAAPEQSLASKDNPAWVESPEDMRARLKSEADANANNPNYRSPLAISVTEGKAQSVEQQRLAFREARKIQTGSYSDQRRYMSDPPLEYRKVDDPAKLTDLGTPESQKAKDRKEQAAIAGSGKKWWQVFD